MTFTIVHRVVHVLDPELMAIAHQLLTKGDAILSRLDDLKALDAAVDAAVARVAEDVQHLKDQIAELQAKVDAGFALTPEEQAILDSAKAKLAAVDPDPSFPPVTPAP
jgi:predicted  nucleic acid-binding Zn-ribbon protein